MEKRDTVLYFHRRKDTGVVFYIGIGTVDRPLDLKERNAWWNNIVNKHGYFVEVKFKNLSWKLACELETRLIKGYGRKDLNKGHLVNLTNGGECGKGRKNTKEQSLAQSIRTKKMYRDFPEKREERRRQILSISHKSIEVCSKPVIGTNFDTGEIKEFPSLVKAAKYVGISPTTIGSSCSGYRRSKSAGRWDWQWKEEYNPIPESYRLEYLKYLDSTLPKKVVGKNLKTGDIRVFKTAKEASDNLNREGYKVHKVRIKVCCKNPSKSWSSGGWSWNYK